ncbi:MAG: hypothetical protein COA79_15195 [Planctomycetota bacterium]|nr:MAG: hypothetical protein COA79_15195 [Planctomycetota bacterium]
MITNFEKEIYEKYYVLARSTCLRRLFNNDSIDDAIQSTFLLYISDQKKIKSNLSSWFYWASVNVCEVINKEIKKHGGSSINDVNENITDFNNDAICLDKLINSLPKKKSELLLMRYFDNLSYFEIAEKTNKKEASIKKTINRTVSFLQTKFKKKDVLISALLAQLFHTSKASSATLNSSGFILQNTLVQQSIVNGVHQIYLFSVLKSVLLVILLASIPIAVAVSAHESITQEAGTKKMVGIESENMDLKEFLGQEIFDIIDSSKEIELYEIRMHSHRIQVVKEGELYPAFKVRRRAIKQDGYHRVQRKNSGKFKFEVVKFNLSKRNDELVKLVDNFAYQNFKRFKTLWLHTRYYNMYWVYKKSQILSEGNRDELKKLVKDKNSYLSKKYLSFHPIPTDATNNKEIIRQKNLFKSRYGDLNTSVVRKHIPFRRQFLFRFFVNRNKSNERYFDLIIGYDNKWACSIMNLELLKGGDCSSIQSQLNDIIKNSLPGLSLKQKLEKRPIHRLNINSEVKK